MPFIEKHEYTASTLAVQCSDLAAMLDTYPAQICRWHDDGLLIQHGGKFYEPMQAIVAIANWEGRGRTPAPVLAWRGMLGEKPNRAAFLAGMECAFSLVSRIMDGAHYPKFACFTKEDPDYKVAAIESALSDGEADQ